MKLRRWIVCLLVLSMVTAVMPVTASGTTVANGHCGAAGVWYDVTWTLEGGVLSISGSGAMFDYNLNNVPWKSYRSEITEIVVSDGVTSIGDYAFYNLQNLKKVTLGNDIESIGIHAFSACVGLEEIALPESLKLIDECAFMNTNIASIRIPEAVETIGTGAFLNTYSLTGIWVDEKNANYSSDSMGVLFNKSKTQLLMCPQGVTGNYKVPYGVKEIAEYAFQNCSGITGVTIPSSVSIIGKCAFMVCDNMTYVTLSEGLKTIGQEAFYSCELLAEVTIPASVTTIENSAFSWCRGLKEIWFMGSPPEIGDYCFSLVTANAHYPAEDVRWTADVRQSYGGTITWVPYDAPAYRLYGDNRWATSLEVADEMKANLGVEKFDTIIIASGMNFADALSGSYLATVKNAPILLCWSGDAKYDYLNDDIIAYVESNLTEGGTVYILGGTSAVPESLETGLEGFSVKRLAGENRFETNLEILKEAGVTEGQEILVCTGTGFADSLSASAAGLPILMVFNELTEGQTAYLSTLSGNTFCVIGGGNAVNAGIETAVGTYGTTTRLAGENRFETSVMVAEKYFENPESVVLAYAWNYPDGLCGGVLAYSMDAPLILTMDKYEAEAAGYIQGQGIEKGLVLGGTGLISDDTVRTIFAMDAEAPVPTK